MASSLERCCVGVDDSDDSEVSSTAARRLPLTTTLAIPDQHETSRGAAG
jgi:hypothetical protein